MTRTLVGLLLLALLAHGASLPNGFVYDDHRFVAENPALAQLHLRDALLDPSTHTADRDRDVYRPVRALAHAFDLRRWGLDPFGFHLHSLLLHALTVVLAWLVLRRLLAGLGPWPPLCGAGLLAVHPLGVEVVGWISSRGDGYALLFGLAALGLAAGRVGRAAGPLALVAGAVCAGLATLGKESAAVLPAVAWLHAGWRARAADAAQTGWRRHGPALALGLGVAAALALRQVALAGLSPIQTPPHGGSLWAQVGWSLSGLARHVGHVLWPAGLSVEYDQDAWAESGLSALALPAAVGLALLAAPVWLVRRGRRAEAFLLAWALLAWLPSGSLLVTLRSLVNDRAVYPMLVPLGALAGLGLTALARRLGRRQHLAGVAAALLAVALVPVSFARHRDFHSDATLHASVLEVAPRSVTAWLGLAAAAGDDVAAAGRAYRRAVEIARPNGKPRAVALARLGDHILRREADPQAALPVLHEARAATRQWREREHPTLDELATASSLAEAHALLGQHDEAERVLEATIADEPQPVLLLVKLAQLRVLRARATQDEQWLARARQALERAEAASPGHPVVAAFRRNLAGG